MVNSITAREFRERERLGQWLSLAGLISSPTSADIACLERLTICSHTVERGNGRNAREAIFASVSVRTASKGVKTVGGPKLTSLPAT